MFGSRLKNLREQQGISQKKLSENLGVAQNTVSNWEKGSREPGIDLLCSIADFFDVSLDYLLGRVDIPDGHLIQKEKLPTKLVDSGVEAATKVGSPTLTEQEVEVLKRFAQQLRPQD